MNELRDQLAAAVAGLLYPSESDEPFDVIEWPAGPGDAVDHVKLHTGKPAAAVPVDEWFAELADSDDAERFRALRATLQKLLLGQQVLRAGEGPKLTCTCLGGSLAAGRASTRCHLKRKPYGSGIPASANFHIPCRR